MPLDLVGTLCDLVRLPSVNPMGRALEGDEYFEWRVTDYLEGLFRRLEVPFIRQKTAEKRENIVAFLAGSQPLTAGGKLLLLEAHQDTVPVDGMTIPPFDPQVREGKVFGRGSCDIKGALACLLVLLDRFRNEPNANIPNLAFGFTVNEEHGFSGAQALATAWNSNDDSPLKRLIPRKPDAAIVMEPTLLNVVAAHKGVARWRCSTLGKAGHSSRPEVAENAIYRMGTVLAALERYANEIAPTLAQHPLVGSPTLSVGTIEGGISVNTVPDRCTIEIDRRIVPLPSDEPLAARKHVIEAVASMIGPHVRVEHEEPYIHSRGLSDTHNLELATRLCAAAKACGAPWERIGVPFGTDAPAYAAIGVPTVVFGPGSIAQAHTCDEWVAIEQLEAAVTILDRFVRGFAE